MALPVVATDFVGIDGERRAVLLALVVVVGDQQLRCTVGDGDQVRGITVAHAGGQGHEGRPVIDGVDRTRGGARHVEDVAREDVDTGGAVAIERTHGRDGRRHAEIGKQLLDCDPAQFHAGDVLAVRQQPADIEGLAAERQEYATARRQGQASEVDVQERIRLALVKGDVVPFPLSLPEASVHDHFPSC